MCGRSSLTKTEKEIESRFKATFYSEELARYNPLPNYNVAPTQMMPVITQEDAYHLKILRWGLIPFWAKDRTIGAKMINARSETLTEKAAFKNLLQSRRCIVPMDGFYEWKKVGNQKVPYRMIATDQDIFGVAGLYDTWKDTDSGEVLHSFTVITVGANKLMESIHDRMPAMLTKAHENIWLDPTIKPQEAIQLLLPYPDQGMKAYRVSSKINSVKERGSDLILEVEGNDGPTPTQLSLF
jgi:putative SOS response-associated peptidase YedK